MFAWCVDSGYPKRRRKGNMHREKAKASPLGGQALKFIEGVVI